MNYNYAKLLLQKNFTDYKNNVKYSSEILEGIDYIMEGSKNLRGIITLSLLEKLLPNNWRDFQQICLIPEFIHSSSLIIDDLPAFDNAKTRRNKECIHLKYSEGFAYIVSYSLITEAILILHNILPLLKEKYDIKDAYQKYENEMLNIISNLSSTKALGGQLFSTYDVVSNLTHNNNHNSRSIPKLSKTQIISMLYQKTSSFFEISIILPWIISDGNLNCLDKLKELSNLLGLTYQIYDDFLDYDDDINNSKGIYNYVYNCGKDESLKDFNDNINIIKNLLVELNISDTNINYIISLMEEKITMVSNSNNF